MIRLALWTRVQKRNKPIWLTEYLDAEVTVCIQALNGG
jgi:hypothetical protein